MSTRRERERRKKLKRIRNAISAAFCVLVLLLVLGIVNLLTGVLEKHLPIIDGNGDYTISILEKLSGDKEEKEPDKKGLTVCIDAGHGGRIMVLTIRTAMRKMILLPWHLPYRVICRKKM